MYHDYSSTSREGWKYEYTGAELLIVAKAKHAKFLADETAARKEMARLMTDVNVSAQSKEVHKCKEEVEFAAKQREACAVYVHEFDRKGERVYNLSLGDVVYFGLV